MSKTRRSHQLSLLDKIVLAEVLAALFGMLVGLVVLAHLRADSVNREKVIVVVYFEVTTSTPSPSQTMTIGNSNFVRFPIVNDLSAFNDKDTLGKSVSEERAAEEEAAEEEAANPQSVPSHGTIHSFALGRYGHLDVCPQPLPSGDNEMTKMEWVMTFQFVHPNSSARIRWDFDFGENTVDTSKRIKAFVQIGRQPTRTLKSTTVLNQIEFFVRPERVDFGSLFDTELVDE